MPKKKAPTEPLRPHVASEPAMVLEDAEVAARVASGALVRLPRGAAPVRDHVLAQLRANLARRGGARRTA